MKSTHLATPAVEDGLARVSAADRRADFLDPAQLLAALLRGAPRIALAAAAFGAAGFLYATQVAKPLYRTTAAIVLVDQSLSADHARVAARPPLDETMIRTQIDVVRSPDRLREVIEKLDLLSDPYFNAYAGWTPEEIVSGSDGDAELIQKQATLKTVREAVEVVNTPGTYILEISAAAPEPSRARDIANALVEAYRNHKVAKENDSVQAAEAWRQTRLDKLQSELIRLESEIASFTPGLAGGLEDTIRFEKLSRESQVIRQTYQRLLADIQENVVPSEELSPSSAILYTATLPVEIFTPRKTLIVLLSVIAGGLIGVAIVIFRVFVLGHLDTPEDLERVAGAPLLGVAPSPGRASARVRRPGISAMRDPAYAAAFDAICANLGVAANFGPGRSVVAVASPGSRDGGATCAGSLGASLAAAGRRVLIIDADLRRRARGSSARSAATDGLIGVLKGSAALDAAAAPAGSDNLFVLDCEGGCSNAVSLAASTTFADLVEEARAKFDAVVLATGPLLDAPEAPFVVRQADVVVLVAQQGVVTAAAVQSSLARLERVRVRPTAVIMSRS